MGSFWIVLLFMGIAALVKRHEANSESKTNTSGAPTDSEKEEIERRIREILGEPATKAKRVTTQPAAERRVATTPTKRTQPAKQQATQRIKPNTIISQHNATAVSKSNAPHSMAKNQAKTTIDTQSPTKSEIENIIEDFSLEKAVIYAEILEPKYKEY